MTTEVTPHAAGLERFCSKTKDYVGRAVVDAGRRAPPTQKLVTLSVDPAAPPCWGTEPVMKGGTLIGYVTSGGMGWRTGKMLAVAWVSVEQLGDGTDLEVQILQKNYKATLVMDPVYDPENKILLG